MYIQKICLYVVYKYIYKYIFIHTFSSSLLQHCNIYLLFVPQCMFSHALYDLAFNLL